MTPAVFNGSAHRLWSADHCRPVASEIVVGTVLVTIACAATAWSTGASPWSLVALGVCGALEAPTLLRWLRGKCDPLDPKALATLLIFHNTFVAPQLHLVWDWYTPLIRVPDDPAAWFGRLALLNAGSLLCLEAAYRAATAWPVRPSALRPASRRRLFAALGVSAFVAFVAKAYFLGQMGGLGAMISAYETRDASFAGTGWVLMLAWPFFLLVLLAWMTAMYARPHGRRPSLLAVVVLLVVFAVGHFAWDGLRGSRLSTLGAVFIAAAYCHLLVRRWRVSLVVAGVAATVAFSFAYNFYKGAGRSGIADALSGTSGFIGVQQQTGRNFGWLLLGDLARADIQMEILSTLYEGNPDYQLKLGSAYVGAAVFIPRSIWPTRPRGPQEAYSELQNGSIAVREGEVPNSRVFGLPGETLLNFGWMGVPVAYALFGLMLGTFRNAVARLQPGDGRLLLVPPALWLLLNVYILDLSEVVHMFFQDAAMLMACAGYALGRRRAGAVGVASLRRPRGLLVTGAEVAR